MFKHAVSLIPAMLLCLFSHGQLDESFDVSGFENYTQWSGNTDNFIVNEFNRLQLSAPDAGQSSAVANFSAENLDEKEWRLWIKHSFSGSDNNQSRYYLATNGTALAYSGTTGTAGVQGYFLRFGEGGSADAVRLYRDDGTANATLILSGADGAIASSFEIRVKVTRDETGLWSLYADYSGGDFFTVQSSATDATYNVTIGTAIVCNYTASNVANFQFDDLYFGPIVNDNIPPVLTGATALSATTVQLNFSESISAASASLLDNYNLPGQGAPLSAVPGSNSVVLTFAQEFPVNEMQSISVSDIEDLAGNTMAPSTAEFMWFIPAVATYRQIVFNELLDDPTPVIGLPEAEYIELFNNSNEPFDLSGWTLVNSTTPKVLGSHLLAPGGYVVLCNTASEGLFEGMPVLGISGFVAMVNGNDSLTLLNPQGDIIDYVAYKGAWQESGFSDGGYALELINPDLGCQTGANWRTSLAETGGTPGAVNSVLDTTADSVAPIPLSVSAVDLSEIFIWISEAILQSAQAVTVTITDGPEVILTEWVGENKLRVILANPLSYGQPYELTVSELADCSGNVTQNATLGFTLGFPVQPGEVLINEIMAAPSENTLAPNAEYIELHNLTDKLIDLSGIKLKTGIPVQAVQIEPFGYIVYTRTDDLEKFGDNPRVFGMSSFPQLTNAGMLVELFGPGDVILDAVDYTDKWYVTPGTSSGGYSLEMINPFAPCSDASNWRASAHASGGTPGEQNSVYNTNPDAAGPMLNYVLAHTPSQYSLVFNESLDSEQGPEFVAQLWEPSGSGFVLSAIEVTALVINPAEASRLSVTLSSPLEVGKKYSLRIQNLSDCSGNLSGIDAAIAMVENTQINDVIINEILSNPRSGGKDFVEIYNRSMRNVSLEGWALAGEVNGTVESVKVFTTEPLLLLSGGYLAISNDIVNIHQEYPLSATQNLWSTPSIPSYYNDEGTVVLLDFLQQEMDKVTYDKSMHFALLDDLKGVSLERIHPDRPSVDVTNWLSAAQTVGFATPGYQNSQFSPSSITNANFTANPELFSPDNDGYQDVVNLYFEMDGPGYAGSITIYDSEGNIVRKLVRNELLAMSGNYSWNGIDDLNGKAPLGIYLAVFEFFNPKGQTGMSKAVCVLGHRLN